MPFDPDRVIETNRVRQDTGPGKDGRRYLGQILGVNPGGAVPWKAFKRSRRDALAKAVAAEGVTGIALLEVVQARWDESAQYAAWSAGLEWYAADMDGNLLRPEPFTYPCHDSPMVVDVRPDGSKSDPRPAVFTKDPKRVCRTWMLRHLGILPDELPTS